MKKAIIIAISLIFLLGANEIKCQYTMNYSVSGGLVIMNILGNNPAKTPFVFDKVFEGGGMQTILGGSFQGAQSGFDINFRVPIDDADKIRVPFGLEYIFFRSKELDRAIFSEIHNDVLTEISSDVLTENRFDLITLYSGMHYVLFKYPQYDVNVYTGFELRGTYLTFQNFTATLKFRDGTDSLYDLHDKNKTDAFRIGACIKFGGEGRLYKNMYGNWFFALTALNIIGMEKSRGELLTPKTVFETRETMAFTYQVGFQVLYKFRK